MIKRLGVKSKIEVVKQSIELSVRTVQCSTVQYVPLTQSSSALTEVGTICPPGHMQKE